MIRTEKRLRLCTVLLICNLAFIWGNSLMPGNISQAFSDGVKELLFGSLSGGVSGGSGLLRKLAHFTEFGALGMCLGWLLGMLGKKKRWPFAMGVAAACIDETIQMFTPGRSPGLLDVGIDSCGVAVGIILLHFGHTYFRKRRSTRNTLEDN